MLKKASFLGELILIVFIILGACMTFVDFGVVNIDLDSFIVISGSFVSIASGFGLVALVMRRIPKELTSQQLREWQEIRVKGKWAYVRNFVLKFAVLVLLGDLLSMFLSYENGEIFMKSLLNYSVLTVVATSSLFFFGVSSWKYHEREYLAGSPVSRDSRDSIESP